MPGPPTDAATVVLLRDSPLGPEVLLVRRHQRSQTFSGASVFPGGVVDAEDADPAFDPDRRFDATAAAQLLGEALPADQVRALHVAACRELFEEAGVLLAREGDSLPVRPERAALIREKVMGGTEGVLPFGAALDVHGVALALDALVPLARWITPESQPRRWDTRFFIAAAPPGQDGRCDGAETCEALWLTPASALDAYRGGEHLLAPPTFCVLDDLVRFGSVAEALGSARARVPPAVIMPVPLDGAEELTFVYPGDRDYPGGGACGLNRIVLAAGRWKRAVA